MLLISVVTISDYKIVPTWSNVKVSFCTQFIPMTNPSKWSFHMGANSHLINSCRKWSWNWRSAAKWHATCNSSKLLEFKDPRTWHEETWGILRSPRTTPVLNPHQAGSSSESPGIPNSWFMLKTFLFISLCILRDLPQQKIPRDYSLGSNAVGQISLYF
jgi:hypothetical protein